VNYRHAYHAGNFGDCMKHALLVWLVRALLRKPAPFAVLDTHAGIGRYDLAAGPAERTGEWRGGIASLLEAPPPPLADYVGLVTSLGLYPGSPSLIRSLLRPADRLIACELHPEDHASLKQNFLGDRQVAVHLRDGWQALGALLPPTPRRGLVLIDPPYEQPDEISRLPEAIALAHRRFATGILAAWYPIKHLAPRRALHEALQNSRIPDIVAAEFLLRSPTDPARLNGCGLVVVNPPFGFLPAAEAILAALRDRLAEPDGSASLLRLTPERVDA
jgi:23S rRNA (adenine2030-N6)-methyltransferase